MQCISPIKAGFDRSGDITYSNKKMDRELATFAFPCRKCLACRLNTAREKAIRCIHEAKIHENNIFLTLTYNNDYIADGRLNYPHFQLFIKRLRELEMRPYVKKAQRASNSRKKRYLKYVSKKLAISYMVTGEYGDKTKRPHWHAIIFNYRPTDAKHKYTSHTDEEVFSSDFLQTLWGKGNIEFGSVTMDSAGYVARYAAKKLAHGKDQNHDYHPIHKTSSKHAIGKRWLERYYTDVFNKGYIVLPNGEKAGIPRYYTDWYKKHNFNDYLKYLSTLKAESSELAEQKEKQNTFDYLQRCEDATGGIPLTNKQVSMTILKQKFKTLQEKLKL
nr:MAG: replication initiator protein [Microvirus sp.]